jgi:hypothetical protein
MWYLWSLLLDDRVRLSRLIAIPSALLAYLVFVYGMFATNSFWIGTGLSILFAGLAVGVWKLGDWWKLRKALRQAQEGIPKRQRGFEVVTRAAGERRR